jgi:hypothetical protein
VALTCALTCFYARLIPRGDPDDDPSATHGVRQRWDHIYFKSRYDTANNVYPPKIHVNTEKPTLVGKFW